MRKNNVLEVVSYLFKNYYHTHRGLPEDLKDLAKDLEKAGFKQDIIMNAFAWLTWLAAQHENTLEPTSGSWRLYTASENVKINTECQNYLRHLENKKILDPKSREIVITQLTTLSQKSLSIADVKWVVLLVLHSQPNRRESLIQLESEIILE